ncbi:alpha/beta hydrolase-fold protein [Pseudoalteromonas sp. Of7M-16]|uniref:alpha/beta hydrolase-fold protein n=1 Tax=Pseudoalteromonas sp. Of7M-16 TaxID=2917756 RepID=UPI001EF6D53F|nr:alpha/beta hydrolase-fold protein [Pseudoalteromonas sp. Of7M-16]MCG7548069.1 esterase [Pseudoalteromonas sp. Of7M-16]
MLHRYMLGILLTLLFGFGSAFAHEQHQQSKTINSKLLNEQRTVTIQLPNSYFNNTAQKYPVIYRLDGKESIAIESAMLNKLHQSGSAPEVIIVAIENTDRTRDLTPTVNYDPRGPVGAGGGGDKFLDFIEKELIPYVSQSYRVHDFKVFSGASIGGLLVLHSFQSRPHLFQGHIAYSPAVWWADETTKKKVKQFVSSVSSYKNYLYMNIGSEHLSMRRVYDDLSTHVQKNKPSDLQLVLNTFNDVPHAMTSAAGVFNAYHTLFLPLVMPNDALENGVSSIKEYYQNVAFQRGEQIQPQEWVLRELAYGLVDKQAFKTAIEIFKYNIALYPKNAEAYNGLAYGYEQAKQFSNALEQVNIALQLANEGDSGFDVYKNRQARLKSLLQL